MWNHQSYMEDLDPDGARAGRDNMICKYDVDAYLSNKVYKFTEMCSISRRILCLALE